MHCFLVVGGRPFQGGNPPGLGFFLWDCWLGFALSLKRYIFFFGGRVGACQYWLLILWWGWPTLARGLPLGGGGQRSPPSPGGAPLPTPPHKGSPLSRRGSPFGGVGRGAPPGEGAPTSPTPPTEGAPPGEGGSPF